MSHCFVFLLFHKFGITWKLFQGVVKPKATLKGKCHIVLTSDERKKLESEKTNDDDEESENTVF